MKEYHPTVSTSRLEVNESKTTSCFVNRTINKLPISHRCDLGNFQIFKAKFVFVLQLSALSSKNGKTSVWKVGTPRYAEGFGRISEREFKVK
jgi:hypothetical protein